MCLHINLYTHLEQAITIALVYHIIQSLRQREILFLDDVIECEREVKQVQTSWRLCVVSCHIFGLLVMVTAVFSSEKVNNNSYESKKISWFY